MTESNNRFQLASKPELVGRSAGSRERHAERDRRNMRSFESRESPWSGSSHGSGWRPVIWSHTSLVPVPAGNTAVSVSNSYAISPSAHMSIAGSATIVRCLASYACTISGAAYFRLKLRGASQSARHPHMCSCHPPQQPTPSITVRSATAAIATGWHARGAETAQWAGL